ncbi:MAG: hypothetical protein AAGU77_10985, partial [Bacillota bacterium]
MMELPLPAVVVERQTALILYANAAAEEGGLVQGQYFFDSPISTEDSGTQRVRITLGHNTLIAGMRE